MVCLEILSRSVSISSAFTILRRCCVSHYFVSISSVITILRRSCVSHYLVSISSVITILRRCCVSHFLVSISSVITILRRCCVSHYLVSVLNLLSSDSCLNLIPSSLAYTIQSTPATIIASLSNASYVMQHSTVSETSSINHQDFLVCIIYKAEWLLVAKGK